MSHSDFLQKTPICRMLLTRKSFLYGWFQTKNNISEMGLTECNVLANACNKCYITLYVTGIYKYIYVYICVSVYTHTHI